MTTSGDPRGSQHLPDAAGPDGPALDLAARPDGSALDAVARATDPDDEDAPLDPAASAALIDDQRTRVISAIDVDPRLLFGTWGFAWLAGFGLLWSVALEDPWVDLTTGAALVVFMGLLVAAIVVTTVHIARRTGGVRGISAQQGAMYGWAWTLSFLGVAALAFALDRLGVDGPTTATVMTVVPPIVVGALYMAGGAMWRDRAQFALGAWISAVTVAAAFVGHPHMLLVMALAGGGGMLVAGVVETARRSAASRRRDARR